MKEDCTMDKITIIGNLGNAPDMLYTPSGKPVTSFSAAANRTWTGQDGEKHGETVWYRASAWNRLAETCNQYLSKGRQVYINEPDFGGESEVEEEIPF